MNKITRDDLYLLSSTLDKVNYDIESILKKDMPSGFKIMLTKLKVSIHENRIIMNKSFEAYDLLERKEKENEKK